MMRCGNEQSGTHHEVLVREECEVLGLLDEGVVGGGLESLGLVRGGGHQHLHVVVGGGRGLQVHGQAVLQHETGM